MRYKTYRGRTKKEALLKAQMECGNSFYVIKEEEKKIGLLRKPEWEITVGILENDLINFMKNENKKVEEEKKQIEERQPINNIASTQNNTSPVTNESSHSQTSLFENIKKTSPVLSNETKISTDNKKVKYSFEGIKKFFRYGDFDDNFIEGFIKEIENKPIFHNIEKVKDIFDKSLVPELKNEINVYLKRKINTYNGIQTEKGRKKVIAFIGPTGSGKTTTLAKLATHFIKEGFKLKLVCIDYYRVGAKEQLQMYSDILGINLEWYNDIDDFKKKFAFNDEDLIMIDTAGRSQKDFQEIQALRQYLNIVYWDIVKCLVVSATTKYYDMKEVFQTFEEEIKFDNVILTKLDETNSIGQALSVLSESGKPLTYTTNGQSVPDYIDRADLNSIISINFNKMLERSMEEI